MSKLYIVPTPIGNLQDITYRSVDVLSHSDFILAEDTRVSKKLLNHYNIQKPMISFHKYNEHKILDLQIEKLKSGKTREYPSLSHNNLLSTLRFSCQKESAIGLIDFFAISKGTFEGRDFLANFAAKSITSRLFVGKLSATLTTDGFFP